MSDSHDSAEALVLAWTSLYTLGLPAPVKRARIDEISSDLWEHSREGRCERAGRDRYHPSGSDTPGPRRSPGCCLAY
jgi:hypothetical protein